MALHVGIDLVSVESVSESLRAHAEHYLQRVYTDAEVRDCRRGGELEPQSLAARFAAKEATLKVLAPESGQAVPWQAIEVLRQPSGSVALRLTGTAAALAEQAGIAELALSLTHEQGFAAAVVIALST